MARVATWPKDEPFDQLPTFDALKERSGLKSHVLRARLRPVPCFKCPDNSVRYDAAAANDVLEPDAEGDELEEPDAPSDPKQAALATTTTTLALFAATMRTLNETIKVMGEPQRRGMELVEKAIGVLERRLDKYDATWDRMITLVEELQSTQAERDERKARTAQQTAMRKEAFDMAKGVLPKALEAFSLTMDASAALDVLGSVDPDVLEGLLKPGVGLVAEDMLPKARKLIQALKKRREAAAAKAAKEAKSDADDTTTAAAEPSATPANDNAEGAPETTTTPPAAEKMPNAEPG